MDTLVTIEVVDLVPAETREAAVGRAYGWFREVEQRCSRFDPESELSQLSATVGTAVEVSPLLLRVLEFALAVARESGGAFDPTVGAAMERKGFDEHYGTGARVRSRGTDTGATHRDVVLDPVRRTVALLRPAVLDLGAVAKGFAIDLAAEELRGFENYAINAGGDIFARGKNADGGPWRIGIRHPREPETLIETLEITGGAVCTSGDYERPAPGGGAGHHILRPGSGESAAGVASVTVVAPAAMLADGLATAAFVLGPVEGIGLLKRQGVDGLIITPGLERFETPGFGRYRR